MRSGKGDDSNESEKKSEVSLVESIPSGEVHGEKQQERKREPSVVDSAASIELKVEEYEHLKAAESVNSSVNAEKKALVDPVVKSYVNEEVKKNEAHQEKVEEKKEVVEEKKEAVEGKNIQESGIEDKKKPFTTFIKNFVTEEVKKGEVESVREQENKGNEAGRVQNPLVQAEEEKKEPEAPKTKSNFQALKDSTKDHLKKSKAFIFGGVILSAGLLAAGLFLRKKR